jgi:MauM/NapG family ferredoxin protein
LRYKPVLYIRHAVQGISLVFFVFLFTKLFYPLGWQALILQWFSRLDPWLLLSHLRLQHNIPLWGWLPLLILVMTILLGRVFCGWLCPLGALLMLVDKISRTITKIRFFKKLALKRTKIIHLLQPMRYFWLIFIVVAFVLGSGWVLFLTPFALFSHEVVRILQRAVPWVLIGIIVCTLLFSRLWCSVLCPTGVLLSLVARLRLFRYKIAGNCVQCGKCTQNCSVAAAPADTGIVGEGCLSCGDCQRACPTKAVEWQKISFRRKKDENEHEASSVECNNQHSRRQFLKIAATVTVATAAATVLWKKNVWTAKKVLRPPGALQEADFTSVCNRCGRCIKACTNKALKPMSITDGIECFETPQIVPREVNCILCLSCQEVCSTGAIAKVQVEKVKMGSAAIDKSRCLAWNDSGKMCFICGEQCPVLAIDSDGSKIPKPVVLLDKCVGCGTCEKGCPVVGEAAIVVHPK